MSSAAVSFASPQAGAIDPKRYGDFNVLVTSDLHIGIGLVANGPSWKLLTKLTRAFVKFLHAHETPHENGKPWKLILNGDFIDFIQVVLPGQASKDEKQFGAEANEENSDKKLALILQRHRAIFRALARFVAKGNMLVCVVGNHDVDFNFRSVRNTFRNHLADVAGVQARRPFCRRIRFYSWFYFEPGLYVEHGHQYDPYSSFHYTFDPLDDAGHIELPASHRVLYYSANRIDIDTAQTDSMTFSDYLRWAATKGPSGMWRLAKVFGEIVVRSVFRTVKLSIKAAVGHETAVAQVARATGLPLSDVRRLDRLRARPAQSSVYEMLSMLYVDRIAAGGAALAGMAASFVFLPGTTSLGSALIVAGLCVLLQMFLARRRQTDTVPKLADIARRIAPLLGVKHIVFGHSHHPVEEKIGSSIYFNTGSFWAPLQEGGKAAVNHVRFLRDARGTLTATSEFAINPGHG